MTNDLVLAADIPKGRFSSGQGRGKEWKEREDGGEKVQLCFFFFVFFACLDEQTARRELVMFSGKFFQKMV